MGDLYIPFLYMYTLFMQLKRPPKTGHLIAVIWLQSLAHTQMPTHTHTPQADRHRHTHIQPQTPGHTLTHTTPYPPVTQIKTFIQTIHISLTVKCSTIKKQEREHAAETDHIQTQTHNSHTHTHTHTHHTLLLHG